MRKSIVAILIAMALGLLAAALFANGLLSEKRLQSTQDLASAPVKSQDTPNRGLHDATEEVFDDTENTIKANIERWNNCLLIPDD
jgi:hypothetical protein